MAAVSLQENVELKRFGNLVRVRGKFVKGDCMLKVSIWSQC